MSGPFRTSDGSRRMEGSQNDSALQSRNPLLCFICDDYYSDPCLLSCYHTFCSRCLQRGDIDGKLNCPLCGQVTQLKDGAQLPPSDMLMRQLIELSNAENPPCANCDKRDKSSMYFCSTCGQALCNHCRENTHKAKMFSSHEVVHMSKCSKEGHRRCAVHGEQFIMFSNSQKNMLCVNCFRDTPAEARLHCVDIDTAYSQSTKKLDRTVMTVCELQNSVREGLMMLKSLLEELRNSMELEKHNINSFCQGMQEAIAKTHANMIMEVQRQFETKERQFRNQLINLGTVLPLLELHLLLCSTFSSSANKYQFLDLAYPMMDRLSAVSQLSTPLRPVQTSQIRTNYRNEFSLSLEPWIGKPVQQSQQQGPNTSGGAYEGSQPEGQGHAHQAQGQNAPTQALFHAPPSKRQQSALRVKALEGEGPFSNHCRSFDTQIKELSQQLRGVKERLGDLHRDVTLLRRAHAPPLGTRYENVMKECTLLEEQLERQQDELERLKNVFDTLWEEQLCRIHVEQEIFQSQMNDVFNLRSEVKHLSAIARLLEPYVKSLSSERPAAHGEEEPGSQNQLQSLLQHISTLDFDSACTSEAILKGDCKMHPSHVTSPSAENVVYMKVDGKEIPVREIPRSRVSREQSEDVYSSRQHQTQQQQQQQHQHQQQQQQQHHHHQQQQQQHQQQLHHHHLHHPQQPQQPQHANQMQQSPASLNLQGTESSRDVKKGVLSQLIEKVLTKEDRKKSPVHEEARLLVGRDRSRSDGRGTNTAAENLKSKTQPSSQSEEMKSASGGKIASRSGRGDSTSTRYGITGARDGVSKAASLYHTVTGKIPGSRDYDRLDSSGADPSHLPHHLPPPPPPTSRKAQYHLEDVPGSSGFAEGMRCRDVGDRIESHLKAKLHDLTGRSGLVGRITRPSSVADKNEDKSLHPDEEGEYQRISEATTMSPVSDGSTPVGTKQAVRALVHKEPATAGSTPTSPHRRHDHVTKMVRLYPASDTEDSVLYVTDDRNRDSTSRKQNSCESLTMSTVSVNSRKSSVDLGDRKTLVVFIGTSSKNAQARLMQKQRSWETFPPKKRGVSERGEKYLKFRDSGSYRSGFDCQSQVDGGSQGNLGFREDAGGMKKADSFEGHEEAVRTLVAAVQETRSHHIQQQKKMSQSKTISG